MIELLCLPERAFGRDGKPVKPWDRLEVPPAGFRISREKSADLCLPDLAESQDVWFTLEGGRIRLLQPAQPEPHVQLHDDGVLGVMAFVEQARLRAVRPDALDLRWPALPLLRDFEPAEPSAETLDVLADAALDAGLPLGDRLRAVEPTDEEHRRWLGPLAARWEAGELEVEWERGVAKKVILRGSVFEADLLPQHALFHLVREVEVTCGVYEVLSTLKKLARGFLPWLSRLTVHHHLQHEVRGLKQELRGLRHAWPRAEVAIGPRNALALRGPDGLRPLSRNVTLNELGCSVRWWGGVPCLHRGPGSLSFNGRLLDSPGASPEDRVLCLKAGDTFEAAGRRFELVPG